MTKSFLGFVPMTWQDSPANRAVTYTIRGDKNMDNQNAILEFRSVTGKNKKFHLKNVSFCLYPGYIYGLIGENGAGKTTLMKYIINEHSKYDGQILVDGKDIKADYAKIMNRIGYVSEDNAFFENRTGKQNAELLKVFYDDFDMDRFMRAAKRMDLTVTKTYKKMSRGERLKFQLAFAIAHAPGLYLLDEVTAGMDPVFRLEFFEILRELIQDETCSILMTSHILAEMEMKTDYVGIMQHGTVEEFLESMDLSERI